MKKPAEGGTVKGVKRVCEKFEMVLVSNSGDFMVNFCGVHHPQLNNLKAGFVPKLYPF